MFTSILSLLLSHYTLVIAFLVGALVHKGWQIFLSAVEGKWAAVISDIKTWKIFSLFKKKTTP